MYFCAVAGLPVRDPVPGIRPGAVSPGFAPFVLDRLFFSKTLHSFFDYAGDRPFLDFPTVIFPDMQKVHKRSGLFIILSYYWRFTLY
jgi:hypothetical protein